MSSKQNLIRAYLDTVKNATLYDIMEAIPFEHHYNNNEYLYSIIKRMIKDGSIICIKKGLFRLSNKLDFKTITNTLF